MKSIIYISALLVISTILSCDGDEPYELDQLVKINSTHQVYIPSGYQYEILQGIDSYVARITNPTDESFLVSIDIGFLAGSYADEDGPTTKSGSSVNEDYIWEIRESGYLGGGDCCAFFTFLNAGPANFVCKDNTHLDLVKDIIETFERL